MSEPILRALVVDDEAVARRVVIHALMREGFLCDPAVDGLDAMEKLRRGHYDLVVTDLLMPNQHGHALSLQLLQQRQGGLPVIVVHTTVDNPRLTKDLIMRGVDDVVYKPAQYEVFAAKMRALVKRQAQRKRETPVEGQESESLTAQDT
jgi:DNA-binding response OmpR family regulator